MATTHRLSTTGVLIVCFVATQWSGTLFARDQEASASPEPSSQSVVNGTPEPPGQASADAAAAVSTGEQGASEIALSPSTTEHFRVTLNNEMFTPDGRLGATRAQLSRSTLTFIPAQPTLGQRGGYGSRGRGRRHGAAAAIVLGAVGTIAGGAILVYANRPDCRTNQTAGGCGYGTKVIGGAVLSAGIVGLVVGALTWR
jgi:hypothetical protein